jgi:aminopeptidase N
LVSSSIVRRRSLAALVTAAALAVTGCSSPSAPTVPPTLPPTPSTAPTLNGTVGSQGLGDPYVPLAGNGGYDVQSYDLNLRYDPSVRRLSGVATITATATAALSQFDLDLRGLTASAVGVDGRAATAKSSGDELVIKPSKVLAQGDQFVTTVTYSGEPDPYDEANLGASGFLTTKDGAVAVGEPSGAASWFPVNDHPRDKATYHITIAAPDGLAALSNGILTGQTEASGYTTWSWVESAPMAPYLATVVIGHYRVHNGNHDGKPVVTAVDDTLPTTIDTYLARTPEVIDYLATKFGPYPFDAEGGIAINNSQVGFALENQTRPVYAAGFFGNSTSAMSVIAHEEAHQWFGDSVSLYNWRDIWLNEGFATYAEWLWAADHGGPTVQAQFQSAYNTSPQIMWRSPPGDPPTNDLFSEKDGDSVYTRGAMTLQALRNTVGDTAFFQILQTWAKQRAGSTGTTDEFISLAEHISGKPLQALFAAWLYGNSRPSLT